MFGVAVAAFVCLVAAKAHAAIYWGDEAAITRASLDGSVIEPKFTPPSGWAVCAIAANATHVFWTDSNGDTIGRANIDGSGAQHDLIRLPQFSVPCGLALDSEYMYWVNRGGDIGRARLDGSEVNPSFIAAESPPCSVAVNDEAIYWGTSDEIWRTDIDGINGPELIVDKVPYPCAIALTDSHLHWAELDSGRIGRANLDGTEPEPDFLDLGERTTTSLAIHGGHLYWLGASGLDRSIGRADLTGANVQPALIGGLHWAYGLAVDGVPVAPRPPVLSPPPPLSSFKLGKPQRLRDGTVRFPVELPAWGWLQGGVPGAQVVIPPDRDNNTHVKAGRSWLKVTPHYERKGGCVLRAFKLGLKVELTLRVRYAEIGKGIGEQRRSFRLFDPAAVALRLRSQKRPRSVDCSTAPRLSRRSR